jgi:hypothetical protein
MLYLKKPTSIQLEEYYNSIKDKIKVSTKINAAAQTFLSPTKIKKIITDTPENLLIHHNAFMNELIPGFNIAEYENYFVFKKLKTKTGDQNAIISKYEITDEVLEMFNYDKYISTSKSTSYNLAMKLSRNTCTYCNRLYTNTIVKGKGSNDASRITRPQFDHWFAKSMYPLLALSFYNLIPSCSVCNSSIKGDTNFELTTHMHPYLKKEADFSFSFYFKNVAENNVKIIPSSNPKVNKILEEFKIAEVYNAHSHLELKDLLDLKYKYTENYINTLFTESFKKLGVSKEEAYRLIFGVEFNEADFHKRSFSKFKKDILKELKVI